MKCYTFLVVVVWAVATASSDEPKTPREQVDALVTELAQKIADSQNKEEVPLIPGIQWHLQKGNYPNAMTINLAGERESNFLRRLVAIPDDTFYGPAIVVENMLEASSLDDTVIDDTQLSLALDAMELYRDYNRNGTGVFAIWEQRENETSGEWYTRPQDLAMVFQYGFRASLYMRRILRFVRGLSVPNNYEALVNVTAFVGTGTRIPSDFDDTFINIGIGAFLSNSKYKSSSEVWEKRNSDFKPVIRYLIEYAYKPFSDDMNNNFIDPRTFFYLRDFLWEMQSQGRTDLALPVTMFMKYDDTFGDKTLYHQQFLNVNNVDISVCANVLYGLTSAVLANLHNPSEWFVSDVQGIYRDTADMLSYLITHNFTGRPDFAQPYYPQILQFMWLSSRSMHLLAEAETVPYKVMEDARDTMTSAFRTSGTDYILQFSEQDEEGLVYFNGFLGDGDLNLFGQPIQRHQDRIFVTATAVNTLLYIWSENGKLVSNMPESLKSTIQLASQWLNKYTLSGVYELYNAYFGAAGVTFQNYAWTFPSNYKTWINKTKVDPDFILQDQVDLLHLQLGVTGVIDKDDYMKMLDEPVFGYKPILDFHGNNAQEDRNFCYWESVTITYTAVSLAMAQYRHYFL